MLAIVAVLSGALLLTALLLFPHELFAGMWYFLSPSADRGLRRHKQRLLHNVHGTVLEIGAGRGSNIKYYPPDRVSHVILVEPNVHMHAALRAEAARCGLRRVTVSGSAAEALPAAAGTVDFVVSTLVLCSVGDVGGAMREIDRVLRPGGHFMFIEHVGDKPGSFRRWLQSALYVPWKVVGDGCHLDRDTEESIRQVPWREVVLETASQPKGFWIAQPMLAGWAAKA